MSQTPITIRALTSADEPRWRVLFDAYTRFYEREPNEAITRHALARMRDASSPVHAIVALDASDDVIGMANYLTHESRRSSYPCASCRISSSIRGSAAARWAKSSSTG